MFIALKVRKLFTTALLDCEKPPIFFAKILALPDSIIGNNSGLARATTKLLSLRAAGVTTILAEKIEGLLTVYSIQSTTTSMVEHPKY